MTRYQRHVVVTSIALAAAAAVPLSAQQERSDRPGIRPGIAPREHVEEGPRPQAFSVALVLGEMQGTGASDNVPAAARKALADVKDFLPYKSYRLLDTQWTLCCGRSAIMTRLRGPDEQDYGLELTPGNSGSGKLSVHFALWEPRAAERADTTTPPNAGAAALLEQQLSALLKTHDENHPDVLRLRAQLDELERTSPARRDESLRRTMTVVVPRRPIIDTSFTMEVGETVVVGTSRLKGDKALIALLTAVAPTRGNGR